jgi:hypothetical protein
MVAPLAAAVLVLVACAGLALRDPHVTGSWGLCPLLFLTGLPCPLCGGLRAMNDVLRGDVVAAVSSNALVVVAIVPAAVFWARWAAARWRGRGWVAPAALRGRGQLAVGAAVLAFGFLRWVPGLAFLATDVVPHR